jgi:hypothetical protein
MIVPAPPDLAALMDAYRAAPDAPARVRAHYDLLRWPGWRKRTTYAHGGVRAALAWGSLKMDEARQESVP